MGSANVIRVGKAKNVASDTTSAKFQTAPAGGIAKRGNASAYQDSPETSVNKVGLTDLCRR